MCPEIHSSVKDGNLREYVQDLKLGQHFLNRTQVVLFMKRKTDKSTCIKSRHVCSLKDPIKGEWEGTCHT